MLYRLLTLTVCEQATMRVFNGNDQFCSISTRVPELAISTIAESNISKQCPQLPQQLRQALNPWKSPSICGTIHFSTQYCPV